MKTHHETDVERVVKAGLARENMEANQSTSNRCATIAPAAPVLDIGPISSVQMTIRTILVPTDFSPQAARALTYARSFAEQFGAKLILLHVTEPVAYAPPYCPVEYVIESQTTRQQVAREGLAGLIEDSSASKPVLRANCQAMVVEGDPVNEINRIARACEVDLIVIATHGYTGISRLFLGSTAEKVVRHAPCPVLVVREKERDFVSIETGGSANGNASQKPVSDSPSAGCGAAHGPCDEQER